MYSNKDLFEALNEEQQLVCKDLKREFEADGIHLQGQAKQRAAALQEALMATETAFMQHTSSDDNASFRIGPFANAKRGGEIKQWLGNYVHQEPQETTTHEVYATCSSNKRIVNPLLAACEEEHIREQTWRGAFAQPAKNKQVIGELIKTRQALSAALDYPSFAHKALANSLIGSPEAAWNFLEKTSISLRGKAQKEIELLTDLKRMIQKNNASSNSLANTESANVILQPWDVPFLMQVAKQQSQSTDAAREVSKYFPMHVCIDALGDLSHSLFGITLVPSPLSPHEQWLAAPASTSTSPFSSSDPSILLNSFSSTGALKLLVLGPQEEALGTVYLDCFHRNNKFTGAAHFTVQCGCSHVKQQPSSSSSSSSSSSLNRHQLPVVALLFSFASGEEQGSTACLGMHDFITLMHEWGHALHSLLSRTTYQHLSGTRGALDFVEVPSHLFEHFARQPDLLARWGRHVHTNARLPNALAEEAIASTNSFSSIEAQTQLLYSMADQFIFGPRIGAVDHLAPLDVYNHAMHGVALLQEKYTDLPLARLPISSNNHSQQQLLPNMWPLSNTHFVTYGGGYYSYLLAKKYSSMIWNRPFAQTPLSRDGGAVPWKGMLQYGMAKDIKGLVNDLAGADDTSEHHVS